MVGTPDSVRQQLTTFIKATNVDELILTGQIYDHSARLRAFEIAADIRDSLGD
jgi:alkanesulfonate monooxygenase SsuD/methylene tetrahydromethanopterin reductase-like flavin-dependent oxidoreductase (luciferase family)